MSVTAERTATDVQTVLMVTEATYPYHWGGLSTWCHALMSELSEIDFTLIAICDDPFAVHRFEMPPNLVDFRPMPLWGVRSAWELEQVDGGAAGFRRAMRTSGAAIDELFLPPFSVFVGQLLGDARDDDALADALHRMYRFFLEHDFDLTFRSVAVWERFSDMAVERFPVVAGKLGYPRQAPLLGEMAEARQWLHHWLFPISQPLPAVDIAHASMGGICSMVSIVCQIEHGAGFLLSEHGLYLREAYLAERGAQHGLFGKIMKLAFARRMTELAYVRADAIAPCCDYNHRWEVRLGVPPAKIHTAYYGLDPTVFVPTEREREDDPPVVVWAGRIDPLKDVETLLHAAAIVRRTRPDARFLLFGSAQPGAEDYAARCLELHHTLGLEGFVSFEGFATNVVEAFGRGDIVVLSSVSEGFPYSTLEAMVCGKPVVATAVGGIAEQVTRDCGRIVPPRDPEALAQGLLEVMADPAVCLAMARAARDRGSTLFGIERFRETHLGIYARVMASRTLDDEGQTTVRRGRRRVESDRRAAVGAAGGARGGRR